MLLAEIPQAYLATFILQIATMLMTGAHGNASEARQAACTMLSAYDLRTETELRLAARIISFNLQIGEALAQAADPATPLSRVIRLRSGAVAMSREAEKAERRLEKLRAEPVAEAAQPIQPIIQPEAVPLPVESQVQAPAPVEAEIPTPEEASKIAEFAQAHGMTLAQAIQHRDREMHLAAREVQQRSHAAV